MKTIIALALLVLSTPALAMDRHEYCSLVSDNAEAVMQARQGGVAMAKAMEFAQEGGEMAETFKILVVAAYKEPRYQTDEMKLRSVQDFRNAAYMECSQL